MPGDDANEQGMTSASGAVNQRDGATADTADMAHSADTAGAPGLPAGARIGDYTIVRALTGGDAARYLARKAAAQDDAAGELVELLAGAPGSFEEARALFGRDLRHAHLLAPRAIVAWDGRDYLVVDACEGRDEAVALPDASAVLAAGVDLADALVYLHRSGVVHQRVSPDAVVLCGGAAYLTGLWHAQPIHPLDPDAPALFARDANFLARTLGALAEGTHGAASGPDGSDPGAVVLVTLVERAEANEFHSPSEVGAACAAALPAEAATAAPMDAWDGPAAPSTAPGERPAARVSAIPAAGQQLRFLVATATSVGRVRSENQDAAATLLCEVHDDLHAGIVGSMPAGVFLIADGMGGEERGDLASRIAARTVVAEVARGLLTSALEEPVRAARAGVSDAQVMLPRLEEAVVQAGQAANAEVRKLAGLLGKTTGSTLTAIVVVGARAAFAHVGDSRAYLLRVGKLAQLTEDHTLLARLEKMQHPLLQEPGFMVPRSYLYRSLGQDDVIELDSGSLALEPGDRLMLCSDGLWDEVDDARIGGLLAGATTPQECADALVRAANDHGGNDNSSVVVVFVGEQSAIA